MIGVELRLRPVEPISGRRVAVFTTGPAPVDHLEGDVVHVSRNLANRAKLREELEQIEADVYLTEIKAAAIDVVGEAAAERGAEVVFADNEVLSLDGEPDLDEHLLALAEKSLQQIVTKSERVAG